MNNNQKYYRAEDVKIIKWHKEPDGSHFIVASCPDGFKGEIPQKVLADLPDDPVLADVEAIAQTWIQTILSASWKPEGWAEKHKKIDMLANNNQGDSDNE